MIRLENYEVMGWEHAIRGMRNPLNSWDRSDSYFAIEKNSWEPEEFHYRSDEIGPNDHNLMMRLAKGGSVHAKYRRMITVYVDITAPLYWWKEFDTYKVGTVANSCSTMHKIHEKEFGIEDFSYEHIMDSVDVKNTFYGNEENGDPYLPFHKIAKVSPWESLKHTIATLNFFRHHYIKTKDKKYWWQMIQLLPSSYNQKRTVMLNYEVLAGIYESRRNHKLDEWVEFCEWIESLPYSEIIIGERSESMSGTDSGSDCGHDCDACDDFDCKNTPDEEE